MNKLPDDERIPVPKSVNMAQGMVLLGMAYLKEHAPHLIKPDVSLTPTPNDTKFPSL